MNLRDEITKAKENEKKRKDEIQKLKNSEEYNIKLSFIKFCDGKDIEDSYKEKILDELQKCIDSRTIKNSILENDIATRFDNKNLPVELKVAFKIIEENEIIRKNLDKINEFFKSNEISELDFDYTIEDIEDRVVQYILKEIEKHTPAGIIFLTENNEQGSSYYDLGNFSLDRLFYREKKVIEELIILKNKNYYLFENDRLINNWCLILYIKYLLKNKKIIYEKNLPKISSDYELNDLSKYGINYITPDDPVTKEEKETRLEAIDNFFKSFKDNPPTYSQMYQRKAERMKNFKSVNEDEFFNTLKENINNKYTGIFYDKISLEEAIQEYNRGKNFNNNLCEYMKKDIYLIISSIMNISLKGKDSYKDCVKQSLNEIQTRLNDIKMYYKFSSEYIVILIIKNNVVLFFQIDIKINDNSIDVGNCKCPRIGIISEKDRIIIEKEHTTLKKKDTIGFNTPRYSSTQKKQHSVIGRAVAGAIIAGPAGGVIGAISAVDKNISSKSSNNYENIKVEPIVIEYEDSYDSVKFRFYLNEYSSQLIRWEFHRDDNDDESDLIDALIDTFLPENLLKGKILSEYMYSSNNFKLEDANMYLKNNLLEAKKHRKELYWKEHKKEKSELETTLNKLRNTEKDINSKLCSIDQKQNNISELIIEFEETKKIDSINFEINELQKQINELSFLKLGEKDKLKKEINKKQFQINNLKDSINSKKDELIQEIRKEKNELKDELENILNQKEDIIEELEMDRL